MKTKSDELQKVLFSISEKLYKNAAPQGNAAGAAPQGGAQPNAPQQDTNGNTVYDADYKDVDDNKDKK
jgi:molecular chaperone DnaK